MARYKVISFLICRKEATAGHMCFVQDVSIDVSVLCRQSRTYEGERLVVRLSVGKVAGGEKKEQRCPR